MSSSDPDPCSSKRPDRDCFFQRLDLDPDLDLLEVYRRPPSITFTLLLVISFLLSSHARAAEEPLRGIVLGLYAADPEMNYDFAAKEIAGLGANSVSLSIVLMQDNARSTTVYPKPGRTATDEQVGSTIRAARAAGLQVMIFPIVLLENPGTEDWRGNLAPESLDAWFASYRAQLLHYATIAREEDAQWLSIGSEFSSLEEHTTRWQSLIRDVRSIFGGNLIYSANWDHLEGPGAWWNDLDAAGLSSYYELTKDPDAPQSELDAAWIAVRGQILAWKATAIPDLPLVFTEVGYPSMDGAAVFPWDYTLDKPVDLDEQVRCYRAFIKAWDGRDEAAGVFFYKWLDFADHPERGYSPRTKPSEWIIRDWYTRSADPATTSTRALPPAP